MIAGLLFVLHLLGAVLWVGGMGFALLALRPALAELAPPQRLLLHQGATGRFLRLVWHVMPIILLTGYAMLFGVYGGFGGVGWTVHLMHLTGLIMSGVFLAIWFGPWQAFRRAMAAGDPPAAAAAIGQVRQLITANFALGLLTVAVAGWGRAGG